MKKRSLSALLALCLILGLLPAAAQGTTEEPEAPLKTTCSKTAGCSLAEGHEGECVLYETQYQDTNGKWVYGTLAEACGNVRPQGTVEVLRDIEMEEGATIKKQMILTSADPENPCTITYTTKNRGDYLLTVSSQVYLADVILDGGREDGLTTHAELVGVRGGNLTLQEGAVLQNNDNVDTAEGAGGLRVISGQAVMQAGSVIRNCRGVAGGGAAVASSNAILVLNGGTVTECEAFLGGGIYIFQSGNFRMQAGSSVCRNQATAKADGSNGKGGGIYVYNGTLTLAGGSVQDNCAQYGGGMYFDAAQVQIGNLSVTGNRAEVYAGGIFSSPFTAIGLGATNAKFFPKVTGNQCGEGYFDDIYLDGSAGDAPSKLDEYSTQPMAVVYTLGDAASIGVSRWVRPDEENPYRVVAVPANGYTITEDDLAKFFSDDPKYVTLLYENPDDASDPDNGTIVITTADVVFDNKNHGPTVPGQRLEGDHKVEEPGVKMEEPGYAFQGWYEDETFETPWDFEKNEVSTTDGQAKPLKTLYAKWDLIHYPITYELQADEGEDVINENPSDYTIESEDITLKEPRRVGYRFLGWKEEEISTRGASLLRGGAGGPEALDASDGPGVPDAGPDIPHGSVGERKFTAQWEKAEACTVTYTDGAGGAAFADQKYPDLELWAGTPAFAGTPTRPGYTFTGWSPEVADVVEAAETVYTAQWKKNPSPQPPSYDPDPPIYVDPPAPTATPEPSATPEPPEPSASPEPEKPYIPPELESEDHFAYIVGFSDGTVRPEADITRSEAVSIFYRLMTDEFRSANWAQTNPFPDVGLGDWYNNAVSTAYRAGLVSGLPDGTFGGGRRITRGEFAAIAARFLSDETAPDSGFPDLEGHWVKPEADRAVAAGWMKGLPDGCFHPDDPITRAEVMTLVNRMLGRVPRAEGMLEGMVIWPDNPEDAWYYADVQEATNSHAYERSGHGPETWTALTENRDWTQLEQPPEP